MKCAHCGCPWASDDPALSTQRLVDELRESVVNFARQLEAKDKRIADLEQGYKAVSQQLLDAHRTKEAYLTKDREIAALTATVEAQEEALRIEREQWAPDTRRVRVLEDLIVALADAPISLASLQPLLDIAAQLKEPR